jgi:MFS family permease
MMSQAGTGGGGLLTPFLMNALLEKYGFRIALRIWSIALIIISTPLIYFIRPRLPISPVSQNPRYGLNFLKDPGFWILQVGLACESLGYFIPSIYLSSFATSLGLSPSIGTMLVAIINASAVFATVFMGMLCDRLHVTTVTLFSTVGATVAVLLFWGMSTALPLLCIFSILYGFFAGGFISSNVGIIKLIKERDLSIDVGIMLGVISAARGLGSITSGPLSEALMRGSPLKVERGFIYGSGYGSLIVFTGVTVAFGGVSFLGKRLGWIT